jgi:transposase-like protein
MGKSEKSPRRAQLEAVKVTEEPKGGPPDPPSAVVLGPRLEPAADPEVAERAARRSFTAEFKRQVLAEADACTEAGAIGALLRRHGLYSSHLGKWRQQRDAGELAGLAARKRGRKPRPTNPLAEQVARLEREVQRMTARAERAEGLVAVQKKMAELLGEEIPPAEELLEAQRRGLPIPPWRKRSR